MRRIASWILGILVLSGWAYGQTVYNTAKERFQLRYSITQANALDDYNATIQQLKTLGPEAHKKECDSEWSKQLKSANQDWTKCYVFPQFPLITKAFTDPNIQPWLGWAPVQEALGGIEAVKLWKKSADTGDIFNCRESICERIVRVLGQTEGEDILALCSVSRIKGEVGAPWNCQPLVIMSKDNIFVRVVTAYTQIQRRGKGLPDFSLRIIGKRLADISSILEATRSALTGDPLLLSTDIVHGTSLIGNRMYQPSRVLESFRPRLREMATVRVDMYGDQQSNLSSVELTVSTTLYVNSMNTVRPEDWTLPDEAKELTYVQTLEDYLKKGLEKTCSNPQWRSKRVLTCGLSLDTPLPTWVWQ